MSAIAEGSQYSQLCTFTTITCYKCGIPFGVPDYFRTKRMQDKENFYCPNGHRQAYVESEADRLRRQIEREKANTEHYRQVAETRGLQRDRAKRQARALKGVVTKVKKRVGNEALDEACKTVYGNCENDNAAQRTVDAIRRLKV